ncbi:MAG TPA: acyltransferase family protein [Flavobacterium sp.]
MEITLQKSNQLKAVAILMMLFLHLFNRDYKGLFEPLLFIGVKPFSYYISLFCDACVPIFCFVSGYGLYFNYLKNPILYDKANVVRIKRLYINYWIILFLFVVVLGLLVNREGYPGNFLKFFLNFTALTSSYNGAWWFLFTYVLLVASSAFLFYIVQHKTSFLIILFCFLLYLIAFYFRVYKPNLFNYSIINWFQDKLCRYGISLFPFILGAISLKLKWNSKITDLFTKLKYKNLISILGILFLILVHGLIPNFIISPFLAIPFIFLFVQMNLSESFNKLFDFMAPHATNMWLIHLFFYMVYFESFIYGVKYVLPIFLLLILCSILSSIVVNKINDLILSKIKFS